MSDKTKKTEHLDSVDLIATGYEWICPTCNALNKVTEITRFLYCESCFVEYEVGNIEIAFH